MHDAPFLYSPNLKQLPTLLSTGEYYSSLMVAQVSFSPYKDFLEPLLIKLIVPISLSPTYLTQPSEHLT